MKLTKNFSVSEFECNCGSCSMDGEILKNVSQLAKQLQILRDKIKKPIKINSGYRCENYNDNIVKGAKRSQHKFGKATDIVVKGIAAKEVYKIVCEMIEQKKLFFGGVGKYNSFTHLDIRENKARWDYSKK